MGLIKIRNTSYAKYEELLIRRDNLRKEAEQIHMEYLRVFGELMTAVFRQKIECIKKKKIIAFCQKIINSGQQISRSALNMYIEQAMKDYNTELSRMIRTVKSLRDSGTVSEIELREIKDLYYSLVRLIHPDIRPDLSQDPVIKDYWNRIVIAYQHNCLDALKELDILVRSCLKDAGSALPDSIVSDLDEGIRKTEQEISDIISSNPYQYRFILEDREAKEERKKELENELDTFRQYSGQLDEVLSQFRFEEYYA